MQVSTYRFVSKAMGQNINGSCSSSIKPDYAVIAGGLLSEDANPKEAQKKLDNKIASVRRIVKKYNATLKLYERVRSYKNFSIRGYSRRMPVQSLKMKQKNFQVKPKMIFVFNQRIEIEAKINSNVDSILVDLVKEGMNYFGKKLHRYQRRSNRSQVLVYYRFLKPEIQLEKVLTQCKKVAVNKWCSLRFSKADMKLCAKSLFDLSHLFKNYNIRFNVGPFMRENGHMNSVHINYPWNSNQFKKLELIGNIAVPVTGNVNMRVPRQFNW